jgi:hypothetical protein
MAGEERRGVEEKKNTLTIRLGACLDGMAGQCPRGRPEATRGRLHHGTTGSTAHGASTGVHTHTMTTSVKHSRRQGKAGEVSSSVATERRKPERDPATDLLGEEAVGESIWWKLKRAQRRVFRPRWQWQSSPESAGIARRQRGD